MRQKLVAKGWEMYHECMTCAGQKQFFQHKAFPDYEVRVRMKTNTFSILKKNIVIAGPFFEYQLEEKLKANVS